ncbi:MAG: hypothetical protein K1000chlam3_01557 [Chlamydiae bacterium]|nr:hypothetical protein [Chlamydiota bacterium]
MKKYLKHLLLITISLFLLSFVPTPFYNKSEVKNIPEPDLIAFKVIDQTSELLKEKYGLHPFGHGMKDKFEYLEIIFNIARPLSKEEAREILIDSTYIFLEKINTNKELKKYLKEYPFTFKNAGITLHIYGHEKEELFHPNICTAACTASGLRFYTNDPDDSFKFKETTEETHEEALDLVKKQNQIAQQSKDE